VGCVKLMYPHKPADQRCLGRIVMALKKRFRYGHDWDPGSCGKLLAPLFATVYTRRIKLATSPARVVISFHHLQMESTTIAEFSG
jgi:hypothetical protein